MKEYAMQRYSLNIEENENRIPPDGTPVRDSSGKIAAAISVSSAARCLDNDRLSGIADEVLNVATAINRDPGAIEDSTALRRSCNRQ